MAEQEFVEHNYEGCFILDSNKYASNPEEVAAEVTGILEKAGATVLAHRPWQENKLAYPINGHKKGVYYLCYFRAFGKSIPAIHRSCGLSETVIRHLVLKVHPALIDSLVAMAAGEVLSNFSGGDDVLAGVPGMGGGRDR